MTSKELYDLLEDYNGSKRRLNGLKILRKRFSSEVEEDNKQSLDLRVTVSGHSYDTSVNVSVNNRDMLAFIDLQIDKSSVDLKRLGQRIGVEDEQV